MGVARPLGFALALALAVVVIPWLLRSLTNAMLFYPERGQHHSPADLGLEFEELRLTGEDGVKSQAWWIPAEAGGAGLTVLHFHGNAGTIADRLPVYAELHGRGLSVLAAEYRGYGDSEGSPSEEGLLGDARVARAEALRRATERGEGLVIAGRSLGGAVAIQTAATAEPGTLRGLWVESTFTSLRAMAGRSGIPGGSRLVAYSFDSEAVIGRVEAPVLVLHGDADDLIPVSHGETLAARVREAGGQAGFVSLPGATHNETPPSAARIRRASLDAFLASVVAGRGAGQ